MRITKIHVKNYKTFKDDVLEFDKLNILIGANASGKSNTISIFRFINHIMKYGIENAISLAGGLEYVLNTAIGKTQPLSLSFSYDCLDKEWIKVIDKKNADVLILGGFDYSFEITAHQRGTGFKITKDTIVLKYLQVAGVTYDEKFSCDESKYYLEEYRRSNKKVVFSNKNKTDFIDCPKLKEGLAGEFVLNFLNDKGRRDQLMLYYINIMLPYAFRYNDLIRIYDFDPKLMKKASSLTSISDLEEDGSNLANILQRLLKSKADRNKLVNLLSDCLPFVKSISTESNFDKSVSYKVQEKYSKKELYANFLSDGTVSVLAIIIALYFEESMGIVILEEPERNLHPSLMNKIIEMAKETATDHQILITTHTPELIKHADVESLLFASRCDEGFTCINKPIDSEAIRAFLENEVGIDTLFAQNLI